VQAWLQKGTPGIDLKKYHFIFVIFDQGQNTGSGPRGLTFGLWRYSTVPFWLAPGANNQNKLLGEVMLHEYIHQFDGFLESVGVPRAISPDELGIFRNYPPFYAPPPYAPPILPNEEPQQVMLAFYKGLLNVLDTRKSPTEPNPRFEPIPIQKLDGRFGRWMA
jgi:hypothetical protein